MAEQYIADLNKHFNHAIEHAVGQLLSATATDRAQRADIDMRMVALVDALDATYISETARAAALATALEVHAPPETILPVPDDIGLDMTLLPAALRGQLIDELVEQQSPYAQAAEHLGDGIEVDPASSMFGRFQVNALCLLGRVKAADATQQAQILQEQAHEAISNKLGLQAPEDVPVIALDARMLHAQMRQVSVPVCLNMVERQTKVMIIPSDRLDLDVLIHEQLHTLEAPRGQGAWWHQGATQLVQGMADDQMNQTLQRIDDAAHGLEHLACEGKVEFVTHYLTGQIAPADERLDEQYRAYYSSVADNLDMDLDQQVELWSSLLELDGDSSARKVLEALVQQHEGRGDLDLVQWLASDQAEVLRQVSAIAQLQSSQYMTAAQLQSDLSSAFAEVGTRGRMLERPVLDYDAPGMDVSSTGIRIPGIDV